MELSECDVLNKKVLYKHNGFSIVRYWIAGWVHLTAQNGWTYFIHGYTGQETVLTRSEIKPRLIFNVKEKLSETSLRQA